MKVKLKVKEMTDAEPTYVSLVERGANKIPFKKLAADEAPLDKGGSPMLNFSLKRTLDSVFKTEPAQPAVLAVIRKGDENDADKQWLEARGFKAAHIQKTDADATIYAANEDVALEGENIVAIKTDDQTVVICSFMPFGESNSFKENIDAQGFLPGIDVALSVLRDTLINGLFDSAGADEANSKISKAVKEFGVHVTGLAQALPTEAFKMDPVYKADDAAEEAVETEEGTEEETETETTQEEDVEVQIGDTTLTLSAEKVEALKAFAETDDSTEGEPTETQDESEAGQDEGGESTEVQKETVDLEAMLKEALGPVTDAVKKVSGEVGALQKRVAKTDEAINGVVGGHAGGDPEATDDSDTGNVIPLIDTGIERITKRASQ
jgi:hypothetical protein